MWPANYLAPWAYPGCDIACGILSWGGQVFVRVQKTCRAANWYQSFFVVCCGSFNCSNLHASEGHCQTAYYQWDYPVQNLTSYEKTTVVIFQHTAK